MLPEITIRSHSSDQFLLDRILYSNSYRINNLLPNSTVVDIGANIGVFCINAQISGRKSLCLRAVSKQLRSFNQEPCSILQNLPKLPTWCFKNRWIFSDG